MEQEQEKTLPAGLQRERLHEMGVDLFKREESINMRVVSGKMLLDTDNKELMFVQNAPRGARSKEIARTWHGRMIRRPDGNYTLTLRFDPGEKSLLFDLIAEVREAHGKSMEDRKGLMALLSGGEKRRRGARKNDKEKDDGEKTGD